VRPRIMLVHAFLPSMPPIDAVFRASWPEAETLNVLDEALYADVAADGTISDALKQRMTTLLRHCEGSGADGIVFTGATFGPAVEFARERVNIPVLKSDEAMTQDAAAAGGHILVACTAARSIPLIRIAIEEAAKAAGGSASVAELWVTGAKDAITRGDVETHDRLIAEQIEARAAEADVIVIGQASMIPASRLVRAATLQRCINCAETAVSRMRRLVADRNARAPAGAAI
jgi:Asp/Glu/hydantoin racemase